MSRSRVVQDFLELRGCSDKQRKFCESVVSQRQVVALYGGAGGGGKSYTLRTLAVYILGRLAEMGFPGQRVTLASSTYDLLRDRHVSKINEEFSGWGEYRESHKIHGRCFIFNDRDMGVIALRNLDDPNKYRGTECAASLVDELTELPETYGEDKTLNLLRYPVRSPLPLPFLPFAAGSNPDGIGWKWVKQLFIDKDYEAFKLSPEQVVFLQATVHDNPKATPEMVSNLQSLTGHLYNSRYLGNWDAPEGARWPQLDRRIHMFRARDVWPKGIPSSWRKIIGIDYGYRAPYACLWFAIDNDGDIWCYREDYQDRLTTPEQASRVKDKTGLNERIDRVYADSAMWANTTTPLGPSDLTQIQAYQDILGSDDRFGLIEAGNKPDRSTSLSVYDVLLDYSNEYPNLHIEESCVNFWNELSGAVWDTRGMLSGKREDLDPRSPDHAISAGYYSLLGEIGPLPEPKREVEITPQLLEQERKLAFDQGVQRIVRKLNHRSNRLFN